jgi:putative transposase
MKTLPCRKSQRLNGYDYSRNGYYFITFCTQYNNSFLGRIESQTFQNMHKIMVLNENGLVLDTVIENLTDHFCSVLVEQYCIMPNHVHMIVAILDDSSISSVGAVHEPPVHSNSLHKSLQVRRSLLSKIIGYLKMNSAKQIRLKNPSIPVVWQRGFHDHIIRNEEEHHKIIQYILTNAQHWKQDIFHTNECEEN